MCDEFKIYIIYMYLHLLREPVKKKKKWGKFPIWSHPPPKKKKNVENSTLGLLKILEKFLKFWKKPKGGTLGKKKFS